MAKQDKKAIGFNVCYPDFEEPEKETYVNGTYLILDTILGKKSVALDIDHLEVIKRPEIFLILILVIYQILQNL